MDPGAPALPLRDLELWARKIGVAVLQPADYPREIRSGLKELSSLEDVHPFALSPCIDYGRFIEQAPWFVLRPDCVESLRSCVVWLSDHGIPFKVRGSGHSSGGQVLIERGAVIDLTGLCSVGCFDPDAELLSVQGGALWEHVATALRPFGRIPRVWTNNLRTTIAGTLSVGGFGVTSSRYGPQIDNVASLKILTTHGVLHESGPGDPLFEYSLAGRGQLGIIVEATVRTIRRRLRWMGLHVHWERFEDYIDDMKQMIQESAHDVFQARTKFGSDSVEAFIGDVVGGGKVGDGPWPKKAVPIQVVDADLYTGTLLPQNAAPATRLCVPALEFVLPLDEGLPIWSAIQRSLIDSDLIRYFDDASTTIGVFRGRSIHPLAPLPGTDFALGVPLRPSAPLSDIPRILCVLRDAAARVLDGGGRIYMMSIDVQSPNFLDRQFRGHCDRFLELKREYDPKGLLNPGLLDTVF